MQPRSKEEFPPSHPSTKSAGWVTKLVILKEEIIVALKFLSVPHLEYREARIAWLQAII